MAKKSLISFSASGLHLAQLTLQDINNGMNKAVKNSINTSLTQARRDFYAAILQEYALKTPKTDEKSAIEIVRAAPNKLSGSLRYKSRSLSMMHFGINPRNIPSQKGRTLRQRKRVTTEVIRGNRSRWNHAFMAKMPNGGIGLFERTGVFHNVSRNTKFTRWRAGGGKQVKTEFIRQKYSTSVPQMVGASLKRDSGLKERIQQIGDMKLNEQIEKLLAKAGK